MATKYPDKSLYYGFQNFLFVETSEIDSVYDYVSSMDKKGMILIARYPKDGSAARYITKSGVYATVWAARGDYTYVLPNQLIDINL